MTSGKGLGDFYASGREGTLISTDYLKRAAEMGPLEYLGLSGFGAKYRGWGQSLS